VVLDVPPGARQVEVRYLDLPFRLGSAVFVAFLAVVAAIWGRRRWRATTA